MENNQHIGLDFSFLDEFNQQSQTAHTQLLSACKEVVANMEDYFESIKKLQRAKSCDFNLFHFFHPSEPTHSRILYNLLNPIGNHGQGRLFLDGFLKFINVKSSPDDVWHITCEQERLDICLERDYPHSIIIVENKSNWACDQGNQLYRYWLAKMHPHHRQENDLKTFYEENGDRYQILYLSPSRLKQPSMNTIKRPDDVTLDKVKLPEELPLAPKPILFPILVKDWLLDLIKQNQIDEGNVRLREWLLQYVEFWNPYCQQLTNTTNL